MESVGVQGGTYIENDGLLSNLDSNIYVPGVSPPFSCYPFGT